MIWWNGIQCQQRGHRREEIGDEVPFTCSKVVVRLLMQVIERQAIFYGAHYSSFQTECFLSTVALKKMYTLVQHNNLKILYGNPIYL